MRNILALGITIAVLAGCNKKSASDTAPSQSITEANASNALVTEAVKAASDQYGLSRGVKAEMVSRNPSKTDRTVCGHTKDGEEWVYQRGSDDKMILLTKADTLSQVAVWPCNDTVNLRRLP